MLKISQITFFLGFTGKYITSNHYKVPIIGPGEVVKGKALKLLSYCPFQWVGLQSTPLT